MTIEKPGDYCRYAAARLRNLASYLTATHPSPEDAPRMPTPWVVGEGTHGYPANGPDFYGVRDATGTIIIETDCSHTGAILAVYIARLNPDTGLAIAEWLEATALEFDAIGVTHLPADLQSGRRTGALSVATAILADVEQKP